MELSLNSQIKRLKKPSRDNEDLEFLNFHIIFSFTMIYSICLSMFYQPYTSIQDPAAGLNSAIIIDSKISTTLFVALGNIVMISTFV